MKKIKFKKLKYIIPLTVFVVIAGLLYHNRGYLKKNFKKLSELYGDESSITDLRILGDTDHKIISYSVDSLNIVGDLYISDLVSAPCIILLHGSSVYGRKLPLIQVLAAKFYDLGYTVLSIDMRGYGDSDDPPNLTEKNFDFADDVISAIDFLKKNTDIDTSKIYVIGHSWGGAVALNATFRDKRIKKAVLFGPTRRLQERVIKDGAPDREYFLNRCKRDMQINYDIKFPVWIRVMNKVDIQNYADKLGTTIPFYLIDASEESEKDLNFLRKIYRESKGKIDYYTIPNTNHYLNTDFVFGKVFYNSKYINDFVNHVIKWLNNEEMN